MAKLRLTLCGGKDCCPEVKTIKRGRKVEIKDDLGGKVILTKKQWAILLEKGGCILK